MTFNFEKASEYFKADKIRELSLDNDGLRFLKLRSISRSDIMSEFAENLNLDISDIPKKKLLEFLFNSKISNEEIEELINQFHFESRNNRIEE